MWPKLSWQKFGPPPPHPQKNKTTKHNKNWDIQIMTIQVSDWQSKSDLDSIYNSCDDNDNDNDKKIKDKLNEDTAE